jgi:hypothetical protein
MPHAVSVLVGPNVVADLDTTSADNAYADTKTMIQEPICTYTYYHLHRNSMSKSSMHMAICVIAPNSLITQMTSSSSPAFQPPPHPASSSPSFPSSSSPHQCRPQHPDVRPTATTSSPSSIDNPDADISPKDQYLTHHASSRRGTEVSQYEETGKPYVTQSR